MDNTQVSTQATTTQEGTPSKEPAIQEQPPVKAEANESSVEQPKAEAKAEANAEESKSVDAAAPDTKDSESYNLTPPEGVEVDPEAVKEIASVAKELGLKQEGAQKLLMQNIGLVGKIKQELHDKMESQKAEWKEQTKLDKEFGGDKLDVNLSFVAKARDQFASKEFVNLLDKSGLGEHPEMVRLLYRVGKAISEDTIIPANSSVPTGLQKDTASILYPNY